MGDGKKELPADLQQCFGRKKQAAAPHSMVAGTRVSSKWRKKGNLPSTGTASGTITNVRPSGTVDIKFDDGTVFQNLDVKRFAVTPLTGLGDFPDFDGAYKHNPSMI